MVSIARSGIWDSIEAGASLEYCGLWIVPLLGRSRTQPSYRIYTPETAGQVEVSEVSAAGSVPNLRVKNGLEDRVLLLDGQELRGAKQNRILNTDVLIAAGSEITIPVSCVERGRWAWAGKHFMPAGISSSELRARKAAYVQESLA